MNNLYLLLENISNGYKINFINLLSLASIFFGILVIISKNPIVSVLFLISLFCTIASYLITLGMHFIGLSYLLVYVGAISILFLFILMLINVRISELVTENKNSIPLAILIGIAFISPIYSILPFNLYFFDLIKPVSFYSSMDKLLGGNDLTIFTSNFTSVEILLNKTGFVTSKIWDANLAGVSDITSIGNVMYSNVLMWLLVTSLILLLSMVGAIIITIKTNKSEIS